MTALQRILAKAKLIDEKVIRPNAGGCAIIALALKQYADRIAPQLNAKVVYFTGHVPIHQIVTDVDSCAHAVLKIGDTYIDSEGIQGLDCLRYRYGPTYGALPDTAVRKSIKNYKHWNGIFERNQTPLINRICGTNIKAPGQKDPWSW